VGEADDGAGVQALVVRIGGTTERPDGAIYHITWSLAEGREAREEQRRDRRTGLAAARLGAPGAPASARLRAH
jgi:hypothetical protein